MTQMYALRLKPGTYSAPLVAFTYVACSAVPSEVRFTSDIQVAQTWVSYQEVYSYLDENLYGIADVVTVVSTHSLLAEIKKLRDNVVTQTIPQLAFDELDKKPASTQLPFREINSNQAPVYRNAIEPLVVEEVKRQLENLPPRLVKYINPAQVIAYALNRLPGLYATSAEGWHRQQQTAKEKLAHQIVMAVRQGLAAVQRDPLRVSTWLTD